MNKNKKGFTILEILIIIAIISLLVTIVLANISSSQEKSRNLAVFYSVRGTADNAFACLGENMPGVRLSPPNDFTRSNICLYDSGGTLVDYPGYSSWPDISKNGWSYADGFSWCSLGSPSGIHPTSTGAYADGSFGGSRGAGNFCYMLKKGNKYIWCMQDGCKKEGF
jgi:prepilin-type N-terminal cleavage/methylation domain-containing protein